MTNVENILYTRVQYYSKLFENRQNDRQNYLTKYVKQNTHKHS